MADIYVDTNLNITIPVNIIPLTNNEDFKTGVTDLAYNSDGISLLWNFVTTAGEITQTQVIPTNNGLYDFTHVGNGMYKIEIPAISGESINNDTAGFGWFTGNASGVLPWRSPVIAFRDSTLNNEFINSSGILNTVVEGSYTVLNILQIMVAVLAGNASGGGTNTISFRDLTDSLDRVVATVDTNGNRTNIVIN